MSTQTAAAAVDTYLSIKNIEVIYDHVILVLKGVSLNVPKGKIVALLGANGAGKSTTLKAISNLLHAERGDVTKGSVEYKGCLLYTSDAADERSSVDLGGRRIIKKKKQKNNTQHNRHTRIRTTKRET